MTRTIPPVAKFMTGSPHSVGLQATLSQAHALLREHGIRHLPVLDAGKLVGMVTQRDLHLIETLKDVDQRSVRVEEAMSSDVYAVEQETPVDEVCTQMAEHKYGSAVVLERGRVVGIFTTVDACRAVAELLHHKQPRN